MCDRKVKPIAPWTIFRHLASAPTLPQVFGNTTIGCGNRGNPDVVLSTDNGTASGWRLPKPRPSDLPLSATSLGAMSGGRTLEPGPGGLFLQAENRKDPGTPLRETGV